jgi:hypothetical protein
MPDAKSADAIVHVDGSVPLGGALSRVGNHANSRGGLSTLSIMCHGFMRVHESASAGQSVMAGGGGLQLCRENLALVNVSRLAALDGFVRKIVVYACGAADTQPEAIGTRYDGRRLFGEMAIHTNAVVLAADVTQYYRYRRNASPNATTAVIDFRGWEGNLWRFEPSGAPPVVVQSNAIAPN